MKTKIKVFISIFTMIFCFSGCINLNIDTREKVTKPKNESIPISGLWTVISYRELTNEVKKNLDEKTVGKIEFSSEFVRIGREVCSNPVFKIKTVKTNQYLIYAYNKTKEELGIVKDEINIISITSGEKHFYDVIYIDNNNAIIHAFNSFIKIRKESSEVKQSKKNLSKENYKVSKAESTNIKKTLKSTVYIGLKSNIESEVEYGNKSKKVTLSTYKTIAINTKEKEVKAVVEVPDLLVPRMTGFWIVYPTSNVINNNFIETLIPYIIEDKRHVNNNYLNNNTGNLIPLLKGQSMIYNINFISNDYVGIEYGVGKDPSNIKKNKFAVFPLDNLKKGPLKVYDVFKGQKQEYFNNINEEFISKEMIVKDDNFSLLRKNGHWIAVGRAEDKKDHYKYEDYILNIIPTNGIMNYDELCVSWNDIKAKVPDAVDAFTSPNKDILIILKKNKLLVYSIEHAEISKKPIEIITFENKEEIVMIEWAVGEYAEKWKKMSEYLGRKISN